jgi:hypothetical protein
MEETMATPQEIEISNAPMGFVLLQKQQRMLSILPRLAGLAEARQASVSSETLQLYSDQLSRFALEDVCTVTRRMALEPRREFETAFPALGDIAEEIRGLEKRRRRDEQQRKQREDNLASFWNWVDERIADTGQPEQEFLDSIRVPGYTGLKARHLPAIEMSSNPGPTS